MVKTRKITNLIMIFILIITIIAYLLIYQMRMDLVNNYNFSVIYSMNMIIIPLFYVSLGYLILEIVVKVIKHNVLKYISLIFWIILFPYILYHIYLLINLKLPIYSTTDIWINFRYVIYLAIGISLKIIISKKESDL